MGISHSTVIQLRAEGIKAVADLADFDKESLQQLVDNLTPWWMSTRPQPWGPSRCYCPYSTFHIWYQISEAYCRRL